MVVVCQKRCQEMVRSLSWLCGLGRLLRPRSRVAHAGAFLLAMVLHSSAGDALTVPQPGAVALPPGLVLWAPFPCGVAFEDLCGYGCGLHVGTDRSGASNDFYANDFARSEPDSGFNKPVTTVAAGEVVYSGAATGGWSAYGNIVLVVHDIHDGHLYHSLYAHLAAASVKVGDRVAAGDTIGLLGNTGTVAYHLHFAMYRDAKVGGGPYGGNAVVPEPLDGVEDLNAGLKMTSTCAPVVRKDGGSLGRDASIGPRTDAITLPPESGPPTPDLMLFPRQKNGLLYGGCTFGPPGELMPGRPLGCLAVVVLLVWLHRGGRGETRSGNSRERGSMEQSRREDRDGATRT
jgi:hypothetical protein